MGYKGVVGRRGVIDTFPNFLPSRPAPITRFESTKVIAIPWTFIREQPPRLHLTRSTTQLRHDGRFDLSPRPDQYHYQFGPSHPGRAEQ
jgi:hypothetical protein